MHQSSQVFNLGRVNLTYIGPGQFNHINDKLNESDRSRRLSKMEVPAFDGP